MTAVLSRQKYTLFIQSARKFLKNPSEKAFEQRGFSLSELKKKRRARKLITVELEPLDGKRDVVGAKILKSFEFLKKELESYEFSLKDSGWH